MRRLSAITILALLLFAFGANSYAQVSSAAVLFLRIAAGARAAGLGEAYVAIANDATATHWNPAGLGKYPLAPKWFQNDIPEEYRPIKSISLVEGEGSPSTDIDFDVWTLTPNGVFRYSNDKWQRADIIETKADDNLESIIRRYTGLIGEGTDERVQYIVNEVAVYNNEHPIERLDSLRSLVMQNLDDDYSEKDDLDSVFSALNNAYNKLIIDWRQVENAQDAQRPEQNGQLEGPVGKGDIFGSSALTDLNQVEIPENAVQHEGDGEHHDVVFRQVGGRKGVQGVGHDRCPGDDTDQLIKQVQGITIQHPAGSGVGLSGQVQLRPAFAEPDEQGEQRGDHV